MSPEDDVKALQGGALDDAGAGRLRQAFIDGQLAAALAIECEQVDGWVWSEHPVHLASLCGSDFDRNYRELLRVLDRSRGGVDQQVSRSLWRWIGRCRSAHEDGSLPLIMHAVLQSTDGWTWDGDLRVTGQPDNLAALQTMLDDGVRSAELTVPEHVGFDLFGRLFHVIRVGVRRAVLELHVEEFVRWTITYPGYPVPDFATSRGVKLGAWVSRMRRKAALGLLDHDVYLLLDDLPGWSWEIVVQPDGWAPAR